MRLHLLRTWPVGFRAILSGEKLHEVRKNDRDYRAGDTVTLLEWDPAAERYTGREITGTIGHVSYGPAWGLPEGTCVFTLLLPDKTTLVDKLKRRWGSVLRALRRA